jgi:hypothetical protein
VRWRRERYGDFPASHDDAAGMPVAKTVPFEHESGFVGMTGATR